jgi:hypothetical protein
MRGGERRGDLPAHLERLTELERRVALARLQVFALEPLHGDVRRALLEAPPHGVDGARLDGAERHDAHDPRVIQLGQELPLAGEARVLRRLDAGRGDDLERYLEPGEEIHGPVDDAHGAAPDLPDDPESTRDNPLCRRIHYRRLCSPRAAPVDRGLALLSDARRSRLSLVWR